MKPRLQFSEERRDGGEKERKNKKQLFCACELKWPGKHCEGIQLDLNLE